MYAALMNLGTWSITFSIINTTNKVIPALSNVFVVAQFRINQVAEMAKWVDKLNWFIANVKHVFVQLFE